MMMTHHWQRVLPVLALAATLTAATARPALAQEAGAGDPYLLTTCPVSGSKLGSMGKPHMIQHEGREIRFCCAGCEKPFKAEPAKYLAKLDQPADSQPAQQR